MCVHKIYFLVRRCEHENMTCREAHHYDHDHQHSCLQNKYRISSHNKNYKMYNKNSNHCKKREWLYGIMTWHVSNGQNLFVDIGQLYDVELVVEELKYAYVQGIQNDVIIISKIYDYGNCNECVVLSVLPFLGHTCSFSSLCKVEWVIYFDANLLLVVWLCGVRCFVMWRDLKWLMWATMHFTTCKKKSQLSAFSWKSWGKMGFLYSH